jgi:TonB family protein
MPSKKFLILSVVISLIAHALLISATGLVEIRQGSQRKENAITVDLREAENRKESAKDNNVQTIPSFPPATSAWENEFPEETVDIDSQDERYEPYLKKIKIQVENVWSYPRQAFERKKEGISTVRFSIDQRGKLVASRIIKSSGYDLLDREALSAVRSAAPYEHFPQDINLSRLHIIASFQYRVHQ